MKRMLWIILALSLLLMLCCGAAVAAEMPWSGSGTEDDPWIISTKNELLMFGNYNYQKLETAGKYWKLGANIDMGAYSQPMTSPLTGVSDEGNSFDGTFDGDGHAIYNLNINSVVNYASLFGRIGASGVVKNLGVQGYVAGAKYIGGIAGECLGTIQNCTFRGSVVSVWEPYKPHFDLDAATYVGGIVGIDGESALISDCKYFGSVSGFSCVGGIVGQGDGQYMNCTFSNGTISCIGSYCGGIVGTTRATSITGCQVIQGNISGKDFVGGIAGGANNPITNCSFSGSVSGVVRVGGIVGDCAFTYQQSTIIGCNASGYVYGTKWTGGIVGDFGHGLVEDCHFNGTVDGTSIGHYTSLDHYIEVFRRQVTVHEGVGIGGIIGELSTEDTATLKDCEADGSVKGTEEVGGIVGKTTEQVTDCINRCAVNGADSIGGIAGSSSNTITGCVNHGNINGTKINIGGIVGLSHDAVTYCENYGNVATTDQVVGGIVGRAERGSISNCKNHGSVSGSAAAGIVSYCGISDITNCLNDGTVSGQQMGWYVPDSQLGLPVIMWANDGTQDNRIVLLKEGNLIAPGCPFTHENTEFMAWSTAADGSGSTFLPGDDFSGMSSNTSLYAYWMNTATVSYIDRSTYTVDAGLLHSDLAFLPSGTYFAPGDLILNNRLIARGDVRLVLLNDTNVVAPKGIGVPQGSSLTICKGYIGVQTGVTGTLTATGFLGGAGIGGNYAESNGTIIINDGIITATGDSAAAGIGGGSGGPGGTVIINGGTVTANGTVGTMAGEGAAGIGGGRGSGGGTVTINGGEVTATGSIYAAGIGGGNGGPGGTVTINGGSVTATGGSDSAGIGGGGSGAAGGTVVINGGAVIATGNGGGAGIGGGNNGPGATVTVNGGEVIATGSTATGGQAAAGIGAGAYTGSGDDQNGVSFTMTDGKVVATAGAGDQYYSLHANAIGANFQRSPGSISIGPYLDAWTLDRFGARIHGDFDNRADTCHESFVTIERCTYHEYDNGLCRWCHTPVDLSIRFEGAGTESSPYLIESKFDWDTLCALNNEGRILYDYGIWFRLDSDIAVDYMLGTEEHHFKSNFDGDGHTLTFNRGNPDDNTVIAPFAYTDGTTIRNLRTAGSITGYYDRASGLIGENYAHSTVENCQVSMSLSGKSFVAAFCVGDGSGGLDIEGCVFDGSLSTGDRSGGFVGWTNGNLTIRNSVFAPGSASASTNCYNFYYKGGSGTPTLTNSYWQTAFGVSQGKQAFSVTAGNDVTIDFGTPSETYEVSGITAYTHGIMYKDVFYAGQGETVTMADVFAVAWDGFCINSFTASAGTLTVANNVFTLTMPSENTVIKAVQAPMFDTTPIVHLTADDGTDGYRDQDPDKLFDGDDINKWCCIFYGNNFVEFHSDVPVVPTAYSMTTAADTSPNYLRRNPYSWKLWGRMNKDDAWTEITTEQENERLPAENCVEVFFPLDNFDAYQYYRLEVTAVRWGGQLQIGEFKLVGTPSFGTATFSLPAGLRTIEESAFEDMTAMISVDAGSVTSVGANAFKDCSALNRIRLSKNCAIDPGAFTGCGTVYIFAPAGGSTEAYCNAHENCVFVAE